MGYQESRDEEEGAIIIIRNTMTHRKEHLSAASDGACADSPSKTSLTYRTHLSPLSSGIISRLLKHYILLSPPVCHLNAPLPRVGRLWSQRAIVRAGPRWEDAPERGSVCHPVRGPWPRQGRAQGTRL